MSWSTSLAAAAAASELCSASVVIGSMSIPRAFDNARAMSLAVLPGTGRRLVTLPLPWTACVNSLAVDVNLPAGTSMSQPRSSCHSLRWVPELASLVALTSKSTASTYFGPSARMRILPDGCTSEHASAHQQDARTSTDNVSAQQ